MPIATGALFHGRSVHLFFCHELDEVFGNITDYRSRRISIVDNLLTIITVKPIFHCNANPFMLGSCVSLEYGVSQS